jgi:hypothetical protein
MGDDGASEKPMQTFLDALPIARERLRNARDKSSSDTYHDEELAVRSSAYFYNKFPKVPVAR